MYCPLSSILPSIRFSKVLIVAFLIMEFNRIIMMDLVCTFRELAVCLCEGWFEQCILGLSLQVTGLSH